MKSIIVILCTALLVTLDAAPAILPSGYDSGAVGEQQSDKMAKAILNQFAGKIISAAGDRVGRDDSIQADDEQTPLNFIKNGEVHIQGNDLGQTLLKAASNFFGFEQEL